jgi:hypothetical protein
MREAKGGLVSSVRARVKQLQVIIRIFIMPYFRCFVT